MEQELMSETQIAEQAYAFIRQTYWKTPQDKEIAEDVVMMFLDFMFSEGEG
jgi:hypothetical protein